MEIAGGVVTGFVCVFAAAIIFATINMVRAHRRALRKGMFKPTDEKEISAIRIARKVGARLQLALHFYRIGRKGDLVIREYNDERADEVSLIFPYRHPDYERLEEAMRRGACRSVCLEFVSLEKGLPGMDKYNPASYLRLKQPPR